MSITLHGVVFLKETHPLYLPGRKITVDVVITPSGANLVAVDAGKGAAVVQATPVTSVTFRTADDAAAVIATTPPGTISVSYGYVQPVYASSGERSITADLSDVSTAGGAFDGTVRLIAFESYGTVFEADIEPVAPADTASPGTGLLGRYFANGDLTGEPTLEVVEQPYFIKVNTVHPTVPERPMSARWTGRFKAGSAGAYRFKTKCDDGARLYIDGRLALDFFGTQNNAEKLTGYYNFAAGQIVRVWIEMRNTELNATMEFSWETPDTSGLFVRVPATSLYSTDGTEALPPALAPPNQLRFFAETVDRY
jgi:PA14 domain